MQYQAYMYMLQFKWKIWYQEANKPIRHVVCAGALRRIKTDT